MIEKEAFTCGTELLMPYEIFMEDLQELEIGISAIMQLGQRYEASLEATAIRYACLYPGACAVAVFKPTNNQRSMGSSQISPVGNELELELDFSGATSAKPMVDHPLAVKYFIKSKIFQGFVKPGTCIEANNPIHQAQQTRLQVRGELAAAVLGSSKKLRYQVECLPLGNSGKILALLWVPCPKQGRIF